MFGTGACLGEQRDILHDEEVQSFLPASLTISSLICKNVMIQYTALRKKKQREGRQFMRDLFLDASAFLGVGG